MTTTDGPDRRSPIGFHYQADPAEDARVQTMRVAQAVMLRDKIREWVNDPTITDLDFAYWLHRYTYTDAAKLCRYSLEIFKEEEGK